MDVAMPCELVAAESDSELESLTGLGPKLTKGFFSLIRAFKTRETSRLHLSAHSVPCAVAPMVSASMDGVNLDFPSSTSFLLIP